MKAFINYVIYFYLLTCIFLLIFSIFNELFAKLQDWIKIKRIKTYYNLIMEECDKVDNKIYFSSKHNEFLVNNLDNTNKLLAYIEAVDKIKLKNEKLVKQYLERYSKSFYTLTLKYAKHNPMDRAFYAYVLATYRPFNYDFRFSEILLKYLENSTVFCRENTLKAIYVLGNKRNVVRAFLVLRDNDWVHEKHLIVDNLMNFTGNKEDLVWDLWHYLDEWEESMQVAIVQFATKISDVFAESFLVALKNQDISVEVHFALIRYFTKWHYPRAQSTLLEILSEEYTGNKSLAVAAASAIGTYPGEESRKALLKALHSKNYYVRYNAAKSLDLLNVTDEEIELIIQSDDKYAIEMLNYVVKR